MKKIFYLTALLGSLLLAACENDIDLDFKNKTPKLTMNGFINADSLSNYLFLSYTGTKSIRRVGNATVEVQVNGTVTETLRPEAPSSANDKQDLFRITSRFRPGDVVRIDARTSDGAHHAWAEVTVPQPPTLVKVDTLSVMRKGVNFNGMIGGDNVNTLHMLYSITIKDRPREKNYYRLVIQSNDTVCYSDKSNRFLIQPTRNTRIYTHQDVVLTDGQPKASTDDDMFSQPENLYGVFEDYRFADKDYTLGAYTGNFFTERYYDGYWYEDPETYQYKDYRYHWFHSDIHVRLLSITETEFRYLKLLNVIDSDAFDEILNEPISFPSNVHGGTGMIGISSETSARIQLRR